MRAAGYVYPYLPYRLDELHLDTAAASTVLALWGAGWFIGQLLCGWLADRIGRRATLASAMTVAAAGFPLLAEARTLMALGVAATISGLVYDAPRPIVSAVVADTIPDEPSRARITGWRHFAVNLGAAVTGLVGGALAEPVGLPVLFWSNALVCAVFAIVTLRVVPPSVPAPVLGRKGHRAAFADPLLWLLWLASLLILIPVAALFSVLPMLMAKDGLPPTAYGWTQVVSATAVIVLSPLLNPWLARRAERPVPMVGLLGASGITLGVGMGAAGLASSIAGYGAATALAVPGEIVAFVAATDILNRITPPSSRGVYAGIWGTTLAAAVLCAPVLGGWALAHGGHHLVALTTLMTGLLGAALCLPLAALLHRSSSTPRAAV
ncbi:MFS transporter [Streptomyces sp. ME02-6987-2C]|nr:MULTISPECIES: MFS transporter [unclassified Streptomyces]MDX3365313.1 MFS transporter [Streptomyces sp. ME02-6987-2C]MDX3422690.1 MFS transporter [Streptomyces sp. ME02-6985-2c]REH20584.1 putative MFS family arabinose efflux permease [Streptomyces sp. 2221.1]SDT29273.1 Predicted arabinose efflux permease, MFS family [Streptomyces sp. 2114.2]